MTTNEKALKMHEEWHGKIETTAKSHVHSREDLSIAYTPCVAEPCKAIAKDKEAAYTLSLIHIFWHSISYSFARRRANAFSLFCSWDFSVWL